MAKKPKIIVVGAGPGGLTAAMILAHRGFEVVVFEAQPRVGGRNAGIEFGGFRFDTGPTFLMMRFILDEVFQLAGRRSADYLEFTKLDPLYHLRFDDREVKVWSNPDRMKAEIRRHFPGEEKGLEAFLKRERVRYDHLYPCLQKDYSSWKAYLSLNLVKAVPHLALGQSLFGNLGRYFTPEKLRLAFTFQSKYLGMSPWECPALFTLLPYVEHAFGIEHVTGGLHRISEGMAQAVRDNGGRIQTSARVARFLCEGKAVRGVRLENGEEHRADAVVLNADFAHAMGTLVPEGRLKRWSPARLEKKAYSCSTFMLYLGLRKRYDLPHHTIVFARHYRKNVDDVFQGRALSKDFSFYLQNASVTDSTLAPKGKSALYVLVPVPNRSAPIDWDREKGPFREQVLDAIAERAGLTDLRSQIEVERMITPLDWERKLDVYRGATFNLAHTMSQLLYFRPHNSFEELDNCYLVGGGTHPGSGLPVIYESARISSDLLSRRFGQSAGTERIAEGTAV